jgi:putative phosphoesterase
MRIGLFSDVHGHARALEKALRVLERSGVDQLYFLGDAVGYIPGITALRRISDMGIPCLRGNHEEMLLNRSMDPEKDKTYLLAKTAAALPSDLRQVITGWNESLHVVRDGTAIHMVHGSPMDPFFGYVYPDTDLSAFAQPAQGVMVMGNTHRPFVRADGERLFINVGSVGLPRDCGRLGAVCVLDTDVMSAEILRFDISEETRRQLAQYDYIAPQTLAIFAREASPNIMGGIID